MESTGSERPFFSQNHRVPEDPLDARQAPVFRSPSGATSRLGLKCRPCDRRAPPAISASREREAVQSCVVTAPDMLGACAEAVASGRYCGSR